MNILSKRNIVVGSPILIILVNYAVAIISGNIVGKWAFIPIILVEWCFFMFFVLYFGGTVSIKSWLKKPSGKIGWIILALVPGIIPLPIFLMHFGLLKSREIWLPWIILALVNPWIEEFYWRGLLSDYTEDWNGRIAVLFSSLLFSANHAVFGVNSELLRGVEIIISTFVMGIIWAFIYKKTNSLRWLIFAHFLVDCFSLSVPSFLDLYSKFGK
jgi:uncharacterized protein